MKIARKIAVGITTAAIVALQFAPIAQAVTYYWDNNGATAGFGAAGGSWAATTTGTATTGWTQDAAGATATLSVAVTTGTGDGENFGTATVGLTTGTITVGTVSAGNATFGSASGAITLSGGTITFGNSQIIVNNASDVINSVLAGANPLTKAGSGTIILTGANTRTGAFTISAGTVQFGNAGTTGSWAAAATIVNNAALSFNRTNTVTQSTDVTSSAITGTGTLTQAGTGILVLNVANSYTGKTSINAGTLSINSILSVSGGNSAVGAPTTAANGTIAIGATTVAGTLAYTGTGNTTDRVINLAGTTGGATLDQSGTGLLKFTSALTATGAGIKTLTLQGSTAGTGEIANAIVNSTSATSLVKSGTGLWTLSGANTYTGGSSITGGTLTFLSTTTKAATGTHAFGAGTTIGLGVSGASGFTSTDIDNAFSGTMTGNLSNVTVTTTTSVAVDTTNGSFSYSGAIPGNPTKALTKLGANALTVTGPSTYTGNTTVSGGTLNITNAANTTTGVFIIGAGTTLNFASFSDYGIASAMGSRLQTSETTSSTESDTSGIGLHFTGGTLQYTGSTAQSTNRMIRLNNSTTNTIDASGTGTGTLTFTGTAPQVNLFDTAGTRTLNLIGSNTGNNTFGIVLTDQAASATSLVKGGTGTWVLSGASTNSGATTINGGELDITNRGAGTAGQISVTGGTLGISNATLALAGNAFFVGTAVGAGTVNQTSGAVSFTSGNALLVGNGAVGTYNLSGGSISSFANAFRGLILGVNNNGQGTFNLSGTGNLSLANAAVQIGRSETGGSAASNTTTLFNQTGGTATVGTLTIGGNGSSSTTQTATATLTGGTFSATSFPLFANGDNDVVSVTIGGTADVTLPAFPTARGAGATATIKFDGGTLRNTAASTAYLGGLTNAFIKAGGLKLDTTNGDAVITQSLLTDAVSTGGGLTKQGTNSLTLAGANTFTGATIVNAGTLVATSASALGTGGTANVSIATGAALNYFAAADSQLAIGGTLTINGGTGTAIGGTLGSTATSAAINVAGNASATGAVRVNVLYSKAFSGAAGTYTLLQGAGGSTLSGATYTLGTVYDNTDFTVSNPTATATALTIGVVSATAISSAYWTGGLPGASNVWAASNGTTASNWAATSGGAVQGLVPGSNADVTISNSTVVTAPTSTFLGANMAIKTLTIADTVNGLGLNADGSTLTITPTSSSTGITMNASVPASTIAANVALGADQTWTNNSTNSLTVSGAISGAAALIKAGSGNITISGANSYNGGTTITSGTLQFGKPVSMPATGVVAVGAGTTLAINVGGTGEWTTGASGNGTIGGLLAGLGGQSGGAVTFTGNVTLGLDTTNGGTQTFAGNISDVGTSLGISKLGGGTMVLSGANTYTGGTTLGANVGTLQATITQTSSGLGTGAVSIGAGSTVILNDTSITNVANVPLINNVFTGSGLLKLQFAANTTARNTYLVKVNGFGGTIELANLGTNSDKWNATNLGTISGALVIDSGSTLFSGGAGTTTFSGGITLNGIGNNEGRGAIRIANGTVGGNITLASNSTISMENTASLLTGNITSGAAGTQILTLGGTGSAGGTLSGNIGGGVGAIGITTAVGGTYKLTGANTYTGATTVNIGTLVAQGAVGALPTASAVSLGATATLQILNDAAGTIAQSNSITLSAAGTTAAIAVGNAGGTTTGSTVAFNALNNGTAAVALASTIAFTGANGYLQSYSSLGLSGLTGGNTTLNPTTTSVTILGDVTNQESGTVTGHFDTLTLGGTSAGNAINGIISDNAGFVSVGNGDTRVAMSGTGSWTLAGANTYSGPTTLTAGILSITNGSALGSVASGTTQSGSSELRISGGITTLAEALSISGGGINNAGTLRNFSGNNNYAGTITVAAQSRINSDSGTLTLSNATAVSEGAFLLVVGGNGNINIAGAVTGAGNGSGSISYDGAGVLTLGGTNTYTGFTNISSGTLKLDYSTNDNSKLSDTAALTLGTATVQLSGGTHAENVLSTTLAANSAVIITRSSGTATLNLKSITVGINASLNVTGDNLATTDVLNTNGILGGWATVTNAGVTDWATNSTNSTGGSIVAFSTGGTFTDVNRLGGVIANNSISNVRIIEAGTSGNITLDTSPLTQVYSLKMSATGGPATIAPTFDTDVLMIGGEAGGGILQVAGAGSLTIGATVNNGVLTTGGTSNTTPAALYLTNDSGNSMIINSAITDNGSDVISVSKTGAGSVTLAGTNTNTGATMVAAGTLNLTGSINTSNISAKGSGVFNESATGSIGGAVTFTQASSAISTLSGVNTYTGATTISAGTLRAGSSSAFGGTSLLAMTGASILDLNGFNAAFTGNSTGAATATVTDNSTGAGTSKLSLINEGAAFGGLITNGASKVVSVEASNNNAAFSLTNAGNTFSGGVTLLNGTTANGTRMAVATIATTTGLPGAITSGPYGTGTITVGVSSTDKAGIYFTVANQTLVNAITLNTGLGSDRFGIRSDVAGITLSGLITANTDAVFSTNSTSGVLILTNKVTGVGGLALDLSQTSVAAALTVTLNSTPGLNDYQGDTSVGRANSTSALGYTANLVLGNADQIPNGVGKGNVIINNDTSTRTAVLKLNGFSETINGLSGNGTLDGISGTPTLTLGDNNANGLIFSGIIQNTAGTLALTKIGTGTQTLTGLNTFSGNVVVSGGTLAAGSTASGTSTNLGLANGTRTVTVGTGATLSFTAGNVLSGNFASSSVPSLIVNGGTVTNAVTNANNANNALGNITLNSGTLAATGGSANYGAFNLNGTVTSTGASLISTTDPVNGMIMLTSSGANTVPTASTIDVQSGTLTVSAPLAEVTIETKISGITKIGVGTLVLTAANTYSGPTTISTGTLQLGDGTTGNDGTIANSSGITNNSTLIYNRFGSVSSSVAIGGTGAVVKQGVGSQTLNATNTYTGATNIQAGTLALGATGSINNSSLISILPTATFDVSAVSGYALAQNLAAKGAGTANVVGAVDAGARTLDLKDGVNIGTLALSSDLSLNGATLTFDLSATTSDQIAVTGIATLAGTNTISVAALTAASSLAVGSHAYTLLTAGSGLVSSNFALSSTSATVNSTVYNFSLSGDATHEYLDVSAVSSAVSGIWAVNASGSYSTPGNWSGGVPGLGANSAGNDTATFAAAATTVNPIVTLDGVSPVLKGITFNNAAHGYTIAQGTGGTLTLNGGASPSTVDVTSGSHTISAPLSLVTNTNITLANAGSLTLSGAQAWAGHNVAVSGAGTITITGTQSNASPATFTVNTGVTANINTDGGTGLSLVNGGVTNLKSSQTLAGVTINNGAHVNVTTNTAQPVATGPSVLVTPTLSIASHVVGSDTIWDGYLDLANNKLVVQTGGLSGTALQAAVKQVASQVRSGYNLANGSSTLWMGTGIGSSSAAADTRRIVGLAVFQNNTKSFGSVDGTVSDGTGNAFITTPFGGATVAKNDTLVKFTYFGDTDLDGVITAGDYANIDLAFAHQQTLGPQSGWANGDFDYDGSITAADYSLMDSAFAAQSGALAEGVHTLGGSLSGSLGSVTAVPEPSTWLLGVLGIIGLLAMARRRRMQIAK